MSRCYVYGNVLGYEGNGEYIVEVKGIGTECLEEDCFTTDIVEPEEITGTCGRLLDEVDMPEDIRKEVEELYNKAVKLI